jgi:hypothetical protein
MLTTKCGACGSVGGTILRFTLRMGSVLQTPDENHLLQFGIVYGFRPLSYVKREQ